jgi:hypothetical protein
MDERQRGSSSNDEHTHLFRYGRAKQPARTTWTDSPILDVFRVAPHQIYMSLSL